VTLLQAISFPAAAIDQPARASTLSVPAQVRTQGERIMVFGDSLSAAYGISPADGWVNLLAERLKPRGISVVNSSISGETSGGGLNRIRSDLVRQKPTIVLVELGANDGLRGLPVAEMRKNLEGIVLAIRAANARAVIVGIQIPPNFGIEYTAKFRDTYAELARQYRLPLVPFLLEGVADRLELFQADRLHPIASAQPAIVQNVLPAIELALKAAPKK
jgi:acyl-CoA thioesterase-1